jgi:hypothetical protein
LENEYGKFEFYFRIIEPEYVRKNYNKMVIKTAEVCGGRDRK